METFPEIHFENALSIAWVSLIVVTFLRTVRTSSLPWRDRLRMLLLFAEIPSRKQVTENHLFSERGQIWNTCLLCRRKNTQSSVSFITLSAVPQDKHQTSNSEHFMIDLMSCLSPPCSLHSSPLTECSWGTPVRAFAPAVSPIRLPFPSICLALPPLPPGLCSNITVLLRPFPATLLKLLLPPDTFCLSSLLYFSPKHLLLDYKYIHAIYLILSQF